jgi:3-(3-hydroxy-phenyl)propionate hydroxylase
VRLGAVVMTRDGTRARIRDRAVSLVTRAPAGRRWLEEMRYAPRARYGRGLVVGGHPLVGTLLPQPEVLVPDGRRVRLDDVLGSAYAVLAVELGRVTPPPVPIEDPLWQRLDPIWIRALLDERFPRAGRVPVIADLDGTLRRSLSRCAGCCVLVRPDRFVAAVFDATGSESTSAALSRLLGPARNAPAPGDAGAQSQALRAAVHLHHETADPLE